MLSRLSILLLTTLAIAPSLLAGENWPNWRGPDCSGVSDSVGLPLSWSESENVTWKTPLPSWAGSSPVIWRDRIFVLTPSSKSEDHEGGDIARKFRRMAVSVEGPGGKRILLTCLSARDGRVRWTTTIDEANKFYGKHNMASPSPVTDGKHVWALTGTGTIACLDIDGKKTWSHNLQEMFGEFGLFWGYASSPCLHDDLIIAQVLHGATTKDPSYLVAFDKLSGKKRWMHERKTDAQKECPDAYTTPIIVSTGKRDELIVSGADYVTAHDPNTGSELWRCGGLNPDEAGNYRICGTPVPAGGLVIATSRVKPVLGIRSGGSGDVTDSRVAWTFDGKKGPDVPSVACDGKLAYLLNDDGFITCLDAASGNVVWGPKRIERGPYSASPLIADGRVYCTNEDGTTTVLAAGPEFKELAKNRLEGGYTLSSFAVANSRLYLRTAKALYCLGSTEAGTN